MYLSYLNLYETHFSLKSQFIPIVSLCFNAVSINLTAIFIWSLSTSSERMTPSINEKLVGKSVK